MSTHILGIIMNGVTGRMGMNQHLLRSIVPIIRQGGLRVGDDTIVPEPLLVGRNRDKLEAVAKTAGITRWTTDLDAALSDPTFSVYFDAQTTLQRASGVKKAIAAGKHIYCEKPTATGTEQALELYRLARARGVKHGVVQDKLWLPGMMKLADLNARGFFGRILSVRGEFGYWVYEGDLIPPSGLPGTIEARTAAGSCGTCSATGATCWTTSSARCGRSRAWPRRISRPAGTRITPSIGARRTIPRMPPSSWRGGSSRTSTRRGTCACAAMTFSRSR
jgi:hypothetical protein